MVISGAVRIVLLVLLKNEAGVLMARILATMGADRVCVVLQARSNGVVGIWVM